LDQSSIELVVSVSLWLKWSYILSIDLFYLS